jgi:hypothetical protein
MKYWFGLALMMAVPAVAAAPANVDITGTWSLAAEVSGVSVAETCALTQSTDGKITGSCDTPTGKYDTTGTIADNTATLQHGGVYDGTKLVMTYTGKVGSDGAMTGTLDVDPFNVSGSFSAKKGEAAK